MTNSIHETDTIKEEASSPMDLDSPNVITYEDPVAPHSTSTIFYSKDNNGVKDRTQTFEPQQLPRSHSELSTNHNHCEDAASPKSPKKKEWIEGTARKRTFHDLNVKSEEDEETLVYTINRPDHSKNEPLEELHDLDEDTEEDTISNVNTISSNPKLHLLDNYESDHLTDLGDHFAPVSNDTTQQPETTIKYEDVDVNQLLREQGFFPTENIFDKYRKSLPENSWNIISNLWFSYLSSMIWTANRSLLSEIGVPRSSETYSSTNNYNSVKKKVDSSNGSIIFGLIKTFGPSFLYSYTFRMSNDLLYYAGPYFLSQIVVYVSNAQAGMDVSLWWGLLLSFGMLIVPIIQTLFIHQYFAIQGRNGIKIASSLQTMMYRKSLMLAPEERSRFSTGEIVNLQSIDVDKIVDGLCYWSVHTLTVPVSLVLALYFTFVVVGWSTFAGVATLAILLPLDGIVGRYVARYALQVLEKKDARSKLVSAMIHGIRIIKYYASEKLFKKLILKARQEEYQKLRSYLFLLTTQECISATIPLLTSLATFGVYLFIGGDLAPEKLFTALSLLTTMRLTIRIIPEYMVEMINVYVSMKRILSFLNAKEIEILPHISSSVPMEDTEDIVLYEQNNLPKDVIISFKNASFKWNSLDTDTSLTNINLDIKKGELMSVIGPVGSGKSTLAHSIFGDVKLVEGELQILKGSTIAYCAQQPWIVNATFRENITMDLPFDEAKYNEVIRVCNLLPDLEAMPAGSDTEISSFGTTLSGGQKARLSLARACYRDADIYILDCPLSAVDRVVATQIYDECIRGYLKSKTIILITHSLQLLSASDSITIMDQGSIKISGSYPKLMQENSDFSSMITSYIDDVKIVAEDLDSSYYEPEISTSEHSEDFQSVTTTEMKHQGSGALTKNESLKGGHIKFAIYKRYLLGFSIPILLLIVILGLVSKVLETGMDAWMSQFKNGSLGEIIMHFGIYAVFAIGAGVITFLFTLAFFQGALWSSNSMHNRLIDRLFHAPISFFDETPSGAILNRCAVDQSLVDQLLPTHTYRVIVQLLLLLSVFGVLTFAFPALILFMIPIIISFYIIQRIYRNVSRQLARLKNNAKTPIFTNINSSLEGSSTIRAHDYISKLHAKHELLITEHNNYHLNLILMNRWVGVRLESLSAIVIFVASLAAIIFSNSISPAIVGLCLSYSLSVTRTFYRIVSYFSSMESALVSVERIEEFSNIDQEAPLLYDEPKVPLNWPTEGKVEFQSVKMRYRPTLDYSLKNLTCTFAPGKRTTIVGRSGSGKSTIIQCLLRAVEVSEGTILIDGVDISKIGLHELRDKIAIIPQHPFIFHGSVRFNIDPFGRYNDKEIWDALEKVRMSEAVENMPEKLNQHLEEGGQGLSIGQQQLLCIARVLLRDCKVVLCDEATASVSHEDDAIINNILKEAFQGRTMIIISHRIHSIVNDVDHAFVMNKARLIESGRPKDLLRNKNSQFSKLVGEEE